MAQNGKSYWQILSPRGDERGASMVEYALLASLIAVAAISSVQALGVQTFLTFNTVGVDIDNALASAGVE